MVFITPAPLTPAFINAIRKNNADFRAGIKRADKGWGRFTRY